MSVIFSDNWRFDSPTQGIYYFLFRISAILSHVCWSRVVQRNKSNSLTVKFFQIRRINTICAKTYFNMSIRNLQIETCQCCYKCCGCIAIKRTTSSLASSSTALIFREFLLNKVYIPMENLLLNSCHSYIPPIIVSILSTIYLCALTSYTFTK